MEETLKQKAGPFPVWTWLVIGVAGLAAIIYYRNKKAAAAASQQAATSSSGDQSNLGTVPISNLTTSAQPMPITMGDVFVDQSQGQGQAQTQGQGQGQTGSGNVSTNVTGTSSNTTGAGAGSGSTPTSTSSSKSTASATAVAPARPPAGNAPTPTKPAPTPAAPKQTTMTVCPWPAWCGSLWGIAAHYYGNGALWPTIYNANKAKIGANPNLIHTGAVLVIPPKPS